MVILWKRVEIAPEERFLPLSTIFCYLMLDFCVKKRIRLSLRVKAVIRDNRSRDNEGRLYMLYEFLKYNMHIHVWIKSNIDGLI